MSMETFETNEESTTESKEVDQEEITKIKAAIEKVINTKYTLDELLREDEKRRLIIKPINSWDYPTIKEKNPTTENGWEKRCMFNEFVEALNSDTREAIVSGNYYEMSEEEANSETGKKVTKLNEIFEKNELPYKCYLLRYEYNRNKLFIQGKVGKDEIYQIIDPSKCYQTTDTDPRIEINYQTGAETMVWIPDEWGIIGPTNKTLSINKLLEDSSSALGIKNLFFETSEKSKRKYQGIARLGSQPIETQTVLPKDTEELGTIFHEIGHALRFRFFYEKEYTTALGYVHGHNLSVQLVGKEKSPFQIQQDSQIPLFLIRKFKATEERQAWSAGLGILYEAGYKLGLESGKRENIRAILENKAEWALGTYDTLPHILNEHPEEKDIPTFSQKKREQARRLSEKLQETGIEYKNIPNYNPHTAENYANDPEKIISLLDTEEFRGNVKPIDKNPKT